MDKSYISFHDQALIHPLKEIDAGALTLAETSEQVVDILSYTLTEI